MRYSIEPRNRIYVKGYGFLSSAKNIGTHAAKVAKNSSNKYSRKILDSAKKSTFDSLKTASKRATQKAAGAAGDLISVSKKSSKELHSEIENEFRNTKRMIHISRKKRANS